MSSEFSSAGQKRVTLDQIGDLQIGISGSTSKLTGGDQKVLALTPSALSPTGLIGWSDTSIKPCFPSVDFERYTTKSGDIILTLHSPPKVALVQDIRSEIPVIIVGSISRLRVDQSIARPGYITWLLNAAPKRFSAMAKSTTRSTINFVNVKSLAKLMITLPALDIQSKIEKVYLLQRRSEQLATAHLEQSRQLESGLNQQILRDNPAFAD